MKKEFALAFNEVLDDKQLPLEVIIEAIESAMVSAYRKTVNASSAQEVLAKIDTETGKVEVFAEKEVVEEVQDDRTEVTLEIAKKFDEEAELGGIVVVESTPEDFGRVAAQTARQVIQQRIREAEREAQYDHYHTQLGEIINGIVQATNPRAITLGLDRKAEGIMPRNHQIRGERFRVHDRVRALLYEVKQTPRGPQITLSRAHKNFLRRLLEDEVPEIYQGLVEIRSIAREPGYRSKVAVSALQPGIDPVGACVGIRGVRIQAIVRELNDEKIDVIEWNPDPAAFIAKALSPARVTGVYLDEIADTKTATVVVPEDQLSLAIGRDGQNARLGAKLTSWRIDIKSLSEAASDALFKLQDDLAFELEAEALSETIPQIEAILAKKTEGRPITPEEYQNLGKFVDQVERGAVERSQELMEERRAIEAEARADLPPAAFDIPLDELGISPRFAIAIGGEGFSTIGDLMMQLKLDADVILSVGGIGPKAMEDIDAALEAFDFPEVEVVEEPEPEVVEEEAVEEAAEAVEEEVAAEAEAEPVAEAAPAPTPKPQVKKPAPRKKKDEKPEPQKPDMAAEDLSDIEKIFAQSERRILRGGRGKPKKEGVVFADTPKPVDPEADKKKGKKKKFNEVEYDPDADMTIVRRKRKGDEGWEEENWE
ncbi:MAG: transcription termination/antitermination protein NusA [Chloroflexi bacterium]|nr:MAG: transcription termination/antitermination protein NusA [Chloroflexota bacterium]MBL1196636.1 transcription termination/antitermination protein NusA [Chloroflexota bacterium]NOH13929.1 transcription termination/antitermination protein NusA [Chloroflexota bacterium]